MRPPRHGRCTTARTWLCVSVSLESTMPSAKMTASVNGVYASRE
jgi:hypothetical protein